MSVPRRSGSFVQPLGLLRPRRKSAGGTQASAPDCSELVRVPMELAGGWWGAAIFIAVLAFPRSKLQRQSFLDDWKAFTVKVARVRGWKGKAHEKYTRRRRRDLEESGPLVTATRKLERERLPAGSVAIDILVAELTRDSWLKVVPCRAGVKVTGLGAGTMGLAGQFAARAWLRGKAESAAEDFANNFTNRAWRASRSVLHLAMALQSVIDQVEAAGQAVGIAELCFRPDWLRKTLHQAEVFRGLLASRRPPLRVPLSDSIRVVPA